MALVMMPLPAETDPAFFNAELFGWLADNVGIENYRFEFDEEGVMHFRFAQPADAVHFKLRWHDDIQRAADNLGLLRRVLANFAACPEAP